MRPGNRQQNGRQSDVRRAASYTTQSQSATDNLRNVNERQQVNYNDTTHYRHHETSP